MKHAPIFFCGDEAGDYDAHTVKLKTAVHFIAIPGTAPGDLVLLVHQGQVRLRYKDIFISPDKGYWIKPFYQGAGLGAT